MNARQQQRSAMSARTMEEYMRMRQSRTPGGNGPSGRGAGPPQHTLNVAVQPAGPLKTRHKLYLATGNENCTKAYAFINKVYKSDNGDRATKKNAFKEAVEVINITKHPELKPPTLKGVPCFLEFSARTGQWRPHYGSAAINAMAFLGANLPKDEASVADMTGPSGYNNRAGFAIDDTYEYDDISPEQADTAYQIKDIDSLTTLRAQKDQNIQSRSQGGVPSIDFSESQDVGSSRGMSIEQLQAARSRLPTPGQ